MDSTRPNRSYLFAPLYPNSSDKAAFSLKKGLVFIEQHSCAGAIAGVFFGDGSGVFTLPVCQIG
jgi:hypothetical protein